MRGHITQRTKDKKNWSIVIELNKVNGKRKQKWYTFHGEKKDAEKFLTEKLREIDTGTYINNSNITVKEYFDYWYEHHCLNNLSPTTYESYRRNLDNYILKDLGDIKLCNLQAIHLQTFYSNCEKRGLSAKTILYFHRIIHCALKQATKWNFIPKNVADFVDAPKPKKYKAKFLDSTEVENLINAIKNTDLYIPVIIAIATGMRRGEILGLIWDNVDLDNAIITIKQALYPTKNGLTILPPKTENSIRNISMSPTLVSVLKKHKLEQNKIKMRLGKISTENNFVCCTIDGKPLHPTRLNHKFHDLLVANNLPLIRFHDLRHSHASLLLKENVQIKAISERLGHSNVNITMNLYSHIYNETNKAIAETFDKFLKTG